MWHIREAGCISSVVPSMYASALGLRWVYARLLMTSLDVEVAQLKFVDLQGYRMAYREWGSPTATDALVLIHGITSSSLSWTRVAASLAARTRVIAVDLKGHGDSDRPSTGYRLADQADEVAGLCQRSACKRSR